MASGLITSWEIDAEQCKQCQTLFWGAPKSLQMVTAAMKLKSDTVCTVSPSISHEVMGPDAMILVFGMLSFKQLFPSPLLLQWFMSGSIMDWLCFLQIRMLSLNCQSTVFWKGFQLFGTPCSLAHQTPLSMGFLRQEYWSGLPFASPEELPNPRIERWSPALQPDSLPFELQGSHSQGFKLNTSLVGVSTNEQKIWKNITGNEVTL